MSDQNDKRSDEFRRRVIGERARQFIKWRSQTHTTSEWVSILGEEFGEVCKACCEMWIAGEPIAAVLDELVQVAAVAEAAYVDLSDMEKEKECQNLVT